MPTLIAGFSSGNQIGNNLPTVDVALPGSPAQAGDYCVVHIGGSTNVALTPPAGWSDISSGGSASSNNGARYWAKFLAAGDIGATVQWSGGSTQRRSYSGSVWRDVDPTTPVSAETPADNIFSTSSSTRAMPSTTTSGTRSLITAVADRNATSAWSPTAGWSTITGGYNTGSGGAASVMAYKENVAAGSVGGDTWTRGAGAATGAITSLIVLNPAPAAGGPDPGDFFLCL